MKLLVTGGSGFLGGHVLAEAARRGHSCVALARTPDAAARIAAAGAAPLAGDLDDGPGLSAAFARAGCEALVNLASLGFGHAPAIVAAAAAAGLDRGVFVSTTAVTTALPAATKSVRLAAEDAIRASGLAAAILRPTMIYGAPGDRNLARLLALLARARSVPLAGGLPLVLPVPGGGRQLQQPVHVADLASAVLTAVERTPGFGSRGFGGVVPPGGTVAGRGAAGARYDIAGPEPLTFAELLHTAAAAVGARIRLVPVPLAPVVARTRRYERAATYPRVRAEQWQRLAEDKAFSIAAAARDLGFAPRSFAEGIRAEAAALGLAPASLNRTTTASTPARSSHA